DRGAKFVKPAEMENEINSADIIVSDKDPDPAAEGEDQGVGNPDDYGYYGGDEIGPESKPVQEDDKKPVTKDTTVKKSPAKNDDDSKPIGSAKEESKKKKGFLRKIFGKKKDN
ncbi:MAG TPA: penicillin-binding protein, partial [Chitinophagaceae bacterium]|nr:penicillin-binding protein [Chitinophagaceae bacterium]